eukprot:Sspe_Gene.36058::Locus_17451_Transcript_1_1_Confidence_1.000_Length_4137::g.36058::m.36058/K00914/PIK3C3, VPS34; phosphatidylinositol 3-kinase
MSSLKVGDYVEFSHNGRRLRGKYDDVKNDTIYKIKIKKVCDASTGAHVSDELLIDVGTKLTIVPDARLRSQTWTPSTQSVISAISSHIPFGLSRILPQRSLASQERQPQSSCASQDAPSQPDVPTPRSESQPDVTAPPQPTSPWPNQSAPLPPATTSPETPLERVERRRTLSPRVPGSWGTIKVRRTKRLYDSKFTTVERTPGADGTDIVKKTVRLTDIESYELAACEARLLKELEGHPNVVRRLGSSWKGEELHLRMEYVTGGTLAAYLGSESVPCSPMVAAHVLHQVCNALHGIHALGYVHRDVKPENVMMSEGNLTRGTVVKIIDMGIAVPVEWAKLGIARYAGTRPFTAPEVEKNGCYDERVDSYAVGVMQQHMRKNAASSGDLSLNEAFQYATATDPKKRWLVGELHALYAKVCRSSAELWEPPVVEGRQQYPEELRVEVVAVCSHTITFAEGRYTIGSLGVGGRVELVQGGNWNLFPPEVETARQVLLCHPSLDLAERLKAGPVCPPEECQKDLPSPGEKEFAFSGGLVFEMNDGSSLAYAIGIRDKHNKQAVVLRRGRRYEWPVSAESPPPRKMWWGKSVDLIAIEGGVAIQLRDVDDPRSIVYHLQRSSLPDFMFVGLKKEKESVTNRLNDAMVEARKGLLDNRALRERNKPLMEFLQTAAGAMISRMVCVELAEEGKSYDVEHLQNTLLVLLDRVRDEQDARGVARRWADLIREDTAVVARDVAQWQPMMESMVLVESTTRLERKQEEELLQQLAEVPQTRLWRETEKLRLMLKYFEKRKLCCIEGWRGPAGLSRVVRGLKYLEQLGEKERQALRNWPGMRKEEGCSSLLEGTRQGRRDNAGVLDIMMAPYVEEAREETARYMLQRSLRPQVTFAWVQGLRGDPDGENGVQFKMMCTCRDQTVRSDIFWNLKVEAEIEAAKGDLDGSCYQKLLEFFQKEQFHTEEDKRSIKLVNLVQAIEDREDVKVLERKLNDVEVMRCFPCRTPIFPDREVLGIKNPRLMGGKTRPYSFECQVKGGNNYRVMVKHDDVRRDVLVMSLVQEIGEMLADIAPNGAVSYRVVATGGNSGMMEMVTPSWNLQDLVDEKVTEPISLRAIREQAERKTPDDTEGTELIRNFMNSCVYSSILVYALAVKDRHLENFLCTDDGKLVPIDFGYSFDGWSPKGYEPPMKLNALMVDTMGGWKNPWFQLYKKKTEDAFQELRENADLLLAHTSTGKYVQDFEGRHLLTMRCDAKEVERVIQQVEDRLVLHMTKDEARKYMSDLIEKNYRGINQFVDTMNDTAHRMGGIW